MEDGELTRKRTARTTLADVARAAGVSPTTVSAVVRGRARQFRISESTCRRIWDAVRDLGYRPGGAARSLRSGRHDTVGYLSLGKGGMLLDSTSAEYMRGIATALRQAHMRVVLAYIEDVLLEGDGGPQDYLASMRFDGLIVEGDDARAQRIADSAASMGIPVVWLGSARQGQACVVYRDEEEAAECVTRHLLELGHTRIAYLATNLPSQRALEEPRCRAYGRVLESAGLTPAHLAVPEQWGREERALFGERPAAAVAHNMTIAWAAREALAARGLTVPRDVSIVSCNDGIESVRDLVAITAASRDRVAMGARAADMLLAILKGDPPTDPAVFHSALVDRGSAQGVRS